LWLTDCYAGGLQRWDSWDFGKVDPAELHAHFGSGQRRFVGPWPSASGHENTNAFGSAHLPAEASLEALGC